MDMTLTGLLFKKPERRKRTKGRKDRDEATVKRTVRAACVERDGLCRVGRGCDGASEWAHLRGNRRGQTRGMEPTRRHNTRTSCMLCQRHHQQEERGQLVARFMSESGADGLIAWGGPNGD